MRRLQLTPNAHAVRAARLSRRSVAWIGLAVLGLALLGLIAAVAVGSQTPAPGSQRAAPGRVVSDVGGAVDQWLLALPDQQAEHFLPTQAELVEKAPAGVRFRILYGDEAQKARFEQLLRGRKAAARDRVTFVRLAQTPSPWVRDFFVSARLPQGRHVALLHNAEHYQASFGRWRTLPAADLAAGLQDTAVRSTPFRLEGGSIVADEDWAFVTQLTLGAALHQRDFADAKAATEAAEAAWGRRVLWLENEALGDLHHPDLYLMPIGEKRVLLGSLELGAQLLEAARIDERRAFGAALRATAARAAAPLPEALADGDDVAGMLIAHSRMPGRVRALAGIRRRLETLGYAVTDVPFLALDGARAGMLLALSYTNVIQDERDGARTVLLPSYRLPSLDRAAGAIWRAAGYRVVSVDCLGPAMLGGALRCLSQVTRR